MSFTIHSPAFEGLPEPLRARIWERLGAALAAPGGADPGGGAVAMEIVRATCSDVPAGW
ncbi:MAG: hypothetical protein AAGB93_07830 [Planctomycetota bacterium]